MLPTEPKAEIGTPPGAWRRLTVLAILALAMLGLAGRDLFLQVVDAHFLREQASAREIRLIAPSSHRGMILDRHGNPLAISTPVDSIWAVPSALRAESRRLPALAQVLGLSPMRLRAQVRAMGGAQFMYLAREVSPDLARRVMGLQLAGVALQQEYRRYYPTGPIAAQVVGFTNIDDRGQAGLELADNSLLRARPGKILVLKDGHGHVIGELRRIAHAVPGKNLLTSIDARIQYIAYRALRNALRLHDATSGTVVVLNPHTGEVLALANLPTFNPNQRGDRRSQLILDHAVSDVYEPGSTMKPFTIAVALESGRYEPSTLIPTSPGSVRIGPNVIHDTADFGLLTVAGVVEKSSNVGASKIALTLHRRAMWDMFRQAGFGGLTGIGLPGESPGLLSPPATWVPIKHATLSFGYGIAITPVQLARAYAAIANDGVLLPMTLEKVAGAPAGARIMSQRAARDLTRMLEMAASPQGTGEAADIPGFRVAGKTGTAHKADPGGYHKNRYVASFAGFAPASNPALVVVVVIHGPKTHGYYGAEVAAPVFHKVMGQSLRLLGVVPDAPLKGSQPPLFAAIAPTAEHSG